MEGFRRFILDKLLGIMCLGLGPKVSLVSGNFSCSCAIYGS